MRTILCLWYLFGCYMMGAACRSLYDSNKKRGVISIIGLVGIIVYVTFLSFLK